MINATMPVAARQPAVAGGFYPADPDDLSELVRGLLAEAAHVTHRPVTERGTPLGILVPHAGLSYSGLVAAVGWRRVQRPGGPVPTIVLLGTNHVAGWLDGIAAWDAGVWETPLGDVAIDGGLAAAIVGLGPPFVVDRAAHSGEHSIEVQLPFVQTVAPEARIVPLAVASGTGPDAIHAGRRLGELLGERRRVGEPVVIAISSDMAHYPPAGACSAATETLLPAIAALDATELARAEADLRHAGVHGLACGMCGIEPTVFGLAALSAMGARGGVRLASATSADAGGPWDRTVGYLSVEFDG